MPSLKSPFEKLSNLSKEIAAWNSINNLLGWDQETYMPSDATPFRAVQSSLVSAHTHKLRVGGPFTKLLKSLIDLETGEILDPALSAAQKAAVQEWRRDYLNEVKIPLSLVKTTATLTTQACATWTEAKKTSNFQLFAPLLEKIVKLNQKKAFYLGYKESPYDALLDLYEPEATCAQLIPLFESLKVGLKSLLHQIQSKACLENPLKNHSFDLHEQMAFGKRVLKAMGFQTPSARLDLSSHPFCSPLHPTDIRMTTRLHDNDVMSNIFSVLHEGGHGLYGTHLPLAYWGTPLGEQASLGIDESQSRFWETRIGRTRAFWSYFLPLLQKSFPQLHSLTLDQFYAAINTVTPSFIRVEADEVTYTLHVILRFEIEKMLLEGSLKVKDIPQAWNKKMEELLGITPPNDALGCLQDIHWAFGSMGYFPTYALGNLYAAQFFEKFAQDHNDWEARVSQGDLSCVSEWLKTHIHQWGRHYTPHELIEKVTGKPLSEKPYLSYLQQKYQAIYRT